MCLICFQWSPTSDTPLTMVANRDEFHARASREAQFWPAHPQVLAGLDLEAGGTWMGVTREGRFAAITNVRRLPPPNNAPSRKIVSRGTLVSNFLTGQASCETYLNALHAQGTFYEGFNLLIGNREECWYLSNRSTHGPQKLVAGLYGLSNAQLNTNWPKVALAKTALAQQLNSNAQQPKAALYTLLNNSQSYPIEQLPNTGIGDEWEKLLSPAFIVSPSYGTRASTSLQINTHSIRYEEATFNTQGCQSQLLTFEF